jgi:hypothetical protein
VGKEKINMKRKQVRRLALLLLAGAALLVTVLAASSVSQAAAINPIESRSRREGPAPGYTPCPVAALNPAAGYPPANGCVSRLPPDVALVRLARQDEAGAGATGVRAPGAHHPGARHPEAVLYEVRDGERQIVIIDLWCLPTIQRPVGVRILC